MQRSAGRESCSGVDDNELMEVFPSGTILPHSVERFCGVDASGTLGSISCLGHFAWACSATRFQPPSGSRWCAAHAVFLMTTEIVCNMSNNFKKKIFQEKTWDLGQKPSFVISAANFFLTPSNWSTTLCQVAAVCRQGPNLCSPSDIKVKYS